MYICIYVCIYIYIQYMIPGYSWIWHQYRYSAYTDGNRLQYDAICRLFRLVTPPTNVTATCHGTVLTVLTVLTLTW